MSEKKTMYLASCCMEREDAKKLYLQHVLNEKKRNWLTYFGFLGGWYGVYTTPKLYKLALPAQAGVILGGAALGYMIGGMKGISSKLDAGLGKEISEKYAHHMRDRKIDLPINPWMNGLEDGETQQQRVADQKRLDDHSHGDDNLLTVQYTDPALTAAAFKRRAEGGHH